MVEPSPKSKRNMSPKGAKSVEQSPSPPEKERPIKSSASNKKIKQTNPLSVLTTILVLIFTSQGSKLLLEAFYPLFGSRLVDRYTSTAALVACIVSIGVPVGGKIDVGLASLLAGLFASASWWVRFVGAQSGQLGPVRGPLVGVAGWSLGAMISAIHVKKLGTQSSTELDKISSLARSALIPVLSCIVYLGLQKLDLVSASAVVLGVYDLFDQLKGIAFLLLTLLTLSYPLRRFIQTLLVISFALAIFAIPLSTPAQLASFPTLSRVRSNSGLIVVGESIDGDLTYRYLRADHSLLGGRWIGKAARFAGERGMVGEGIGVGDIGDSVFSAFVLQEAVRLINRPPRAVSSSEREKALIIGLGAGIAARAMIVHNCLTTIVEYDPAVYDAARTYFHLPSSDAVFIEDANVFVQRAAAVAKRDLGEKGGYDYVLHDVFTGGGIAGELFTVEFWDDLKQILRPDGVLSVNFAGVQNSTSADLVISTLLDAFPTCRGFRDVMGESEDSNDGALKNMVIFCTPFTTPSISFRDIDVAADLLHSQLRHKVLPTLMDSEVDLSAYRLSTGDSASQGLLRRGFAGKRLDVVQTEAALATWKAMREIMPVEVWNNW
ncbi:Spermidine/spermine synthases family [Phaffia rhodozyma]|uniref:Spermidine/spermine synthases family n=1 Tax=Phaffia rhodozyma TaxID=264483 RepID=A0A0F7SRE4_PHARH|nr:Spermidine/spermine synthases family [Phaffia rhodozyma]